MKTIYLVLLTVLFAGSAEAQMENWTLIGVERNNEFIVSTNKKELLKKINNNFDSDYNKLNIASGYTIGEKKEKYYYLEIISSDTGSRLVRWLTHKDGKFYFETTGHGDVSHLDFYTTCEGEGNCRPNLVSFNNELNWICGDGAAGSGDAKRNCKKEVSVLDGTF